MRPRLAPSAARTAISLLPCRALRQQQVGDVRAGDQQHEHHRAERDVDRLAQGCRRPAARSNGSTPTLQSFFQAGIVSAICARTASRSCLRLRDRDAGLQRVPPDSASACWRPVPPRVKAFKRQKLAGSSSGRARWRSNAPGRQHADHPVRLVVEQQLAAQDGRVAAEIGLPGGVAEDDDAGAPAWSSSARNVRPMNGCTPNTAK